MLKRILGKYSLNYCINTSLKTNKLYKIFNKNTVKINYSCMRNMGSIISAQNQHLLRPDNSSFGCTCRNKSNYLLEEKWLTPKVIYQADVTNDVDDEYNV